MSTTPRPPEYMFLTGKVEELGEVAGPHLGQLLDPGDSYYPVLFDRTQAYLEDFATKYPDKPYLPGIAAMTPITACMGRAAFDAVAAGVLKPSDADVTSRGCTIRIAHTAVLRYAQDAGTLDEYLAMHHTVWASSDFAGYYSEGHRETVRSGIDRLFNDAMRDMGHLADGVLANARRLGWTDAEAREVMKASRGLRVIGAATGAIDAMVGREAPDYKQPGALEIIAPKPGASLPTLAVSRNIIEEYLQIQEGPGHGCPMRYVKDPLGGTVFDALWNPAVDYLLIDGVEQLPWFLRG